MEVNKKVFRNIFLIAAGCIILYWLIGERARFELIVETVNGITSPFIFGSVLAFILNVPMRRIEWLFKGIPNARWRRTLAVLITFIVVILVIVGVCVLLVPQLSDTIQMLIPKLTSFVVEIGDRVNHLLETNPEVMDWLAENTSFEELDWAGLVEKAVSIIGSSFGKIIGSTLFAIGKLTSIAMDLVIGLVFAIYCLFQKETLARQGRKLAYAFLPEKSADYIVRILRLSNVTFSSFLAGQCIEVLILGVMFAIAMSIFGMPYIPLVSVVIAITAFIPVVGTWVGCIFGAFFIFVANPVQAFWFVIMFIILQQVENNLIYPKVVGTSIGLSGMWVLVAVGIGGQLMGIAGMFLMIPIVSVVFTLLKEHTNHRLHLREVDGEKLQVQALDLSAKAKKKKSVGEKKSSKKKENKE